jgi:SAM-dependent methyltransferase
MSSRFLASKFGLRRPALDVPVRLNRNSPKVTALMPPEESGRWLLERMRQRIGFDTYADKKLLDFGCGVRFSQAIINTRFKIGGYVGVDNCRELIEFLRGNVQDRRFAYHFLDARHPLYHPTGQALTSSTVLPVDSDFDVAAMFSVITHQDPTDARHIFTILRRHVKGGGHLFFTCFLDDGIDTFEDRSADQNGGMCFYNRSFLVSLVTDCGWSMVSSAPGEGPLIGDSFVLRPA